MVFYQEGSGMVLMQLHRFKIKRMEDFTANPKDQEQNPIGNELNVEVSIPKRFIIKMVDVTSLNDYEIWVFIASLICNFLVGFVVATVSADAGVRGVYISFDILCAILLVLAIVMAVIKRKKMSIEKKSINLSLRKNE